jgi:hypothetical protein
MQCHLGPVRLYNMFRDYLIKCAISENQILVENKMFVFRFSLQLLSETFVIPRRTERDIIPNVHRSLCKVAVILVRL